MAIIIRAWTVHMLRKRRMLDDWDTLILVDEPYEAQSIILMDNMYILPTLHVFWLLRGENQTIPMTFCP